MTPADELHAAAKKIRETAAKATEGPWQMDGPMWWSEQDCTHVITDARNRWPVAILPTAQEAGDRRDGDAAWIALASPQIAEPIAAWLEGAGYDLGGAEAYLARTVPGEIFDPFEYVDEPDSVRAALAVARAINGGAR